MWTIYLEIWSVVRVFSKTLEFAIKLVHGENIQKLIGIEGIVSLNNIG